MQRSLCASAVAIAAACVYWALQRWRQGGPGKLEDGTGSDAPARKGPTDGTAGHEAPAAPGHGAARPRSQQPSRNKGAERLEWWQRLNQVKPELLLPELQGAGPQGLRASAAAPEAYREVARVAGERLGRGRDWLVRDSDYGEAPAHSAVKAKVNAALRAAVAEVFGAALPQRLAEDPRRLLLLLDTPQYGTLRELVAAFPQLQCSQQVVIPQADLKHYFEMVRGSEFYPGVRAQRLDHWLCANAGLGLRCLAAFLDFECRLVGALSARLCPAADVMRYFRFGYPAEPVSVLALTVGLESPAATPEDVDAFVRWEAALNGYSAELRQVWKYRMVSLLYVVRRTEGGPEAAVAALLRQEGAGGAASACRLRLAGTDDGAASGEER
mmetsp:Transcript_46327/g.143498  ORF Transcript_46327/g.143498 Transcript_46327/m.143498 type:complete len:384 (-) Transcript_46327:44-1195(-)